MASLGNFDIGVETGKEVESFKVGTIIVAVGADILKPKGLYLYGEDPRVVTQSELEQLLHSWQSRRREDYHDPVRWLTQHRASLLQPDML